MVGVEVAAASSTPAAEVMTATDMGMIITARMIIILTVPSSAL